MSYYVELRRTVERTGLLRYVPLESIESFTGFRSVYAVDEALRDLILAEGTVAGLSGFPVYSDTLFVDFDSDAGVDEFCTFLRSRRLRFKRYTTGRRGAHVHVRCMPMFGSAVPHSQLRWVSDHVKGAWDETVYRHHSIIRLPGTWHEKAPGRRKELVDEGPGNFLSIPTVDVPAPTQGVGPQGTRGGRTESEFWAMTLLPKAEPGRTFRVYRLGALARECGVDYEQGLQAAHAWATNWASPPLTNQLEIERAFRSGYKGGGRG